MATIYIVKEEKTGQNVIRNTSYDLPLHEIGDEVKYLAGETEVSSGIITSIESEQTKVGKNYITMHRYVIDENIFVLEDEIL